MVDVFRKSCLANSASSVSTAEPDENNRLKWPPLGICESWMRDFDSFNLLSFSLLDLERFEFDHVLRPSSALWKAQIEVHLDRRVGSKVVAKRFFRAYLKDSPVDFRKAKSGGSEDPWSELFLALKLGKHLPGPGVLPCHGIFIHPSGDVMVMMEYATCGDLFDLAGCLGEPGPPREVLAVQLLRSLLRAVRFLHHEVGIAHGDISLENVLLRDRPDSTGGPDVALLDFARAVCHGASARAEVRRHIGAGDMYRPPEGWCVDARRADLFACGVVGYVLAIGTYPWQSTRGCKAFEYVKKNGLARFFQKRTVPVGSAQVPVAELLSPRLQAALMALLDVDSFHCSELCEMLLDGLLMEQRAQPLETEPATPLSRCFGGVFFVVKCLVR
ncbi:Death-associated protein kinase 1 (DAP kinase 1) [Durusdinium trenchii]|uniref:Death-associated protein kinase 1 (DAP kinase 1) n=1 Tax=Durusdinium trenchii TaxID=1381693 RepID=A0ABP0JWV9_9DINO